MIDVAITSELDRNEYFDILFDEGKYREINAKISFRRSIEVCGHKESMLTALRQHRARTGLKDAIRTAQGKLAGEDIIVAAMDFSFIGGSMGSVMGEKIARAIDAGH